MKKFIDSSLFVILGFIITLLLNTGIDYLLWKKGRISVSPPVSMQSGFYLPITITNFSSETINDLRFSVPTVTNIKKIIPSYSIDITEKTTPNIDLTTKKVIFSGIEPKNVLTILIPLPSIEDFEKIKSLNPFELRMTYSSFKSIKHPIKESFYNGLQIAIIYSIFFALLLYYDAHKIEKLNKKIEETNRKIETQEIECISCRNESKRKAEDALKSLRRIQVTLLSRISDYAKELSFWRDTIRKILYDKEKLEDSSEMIIKKISENLKTYSTLKGDYLHSFDSAQAIADMIAYREKSNRE